MNNEPSKDPILRGLIEREKTRAVRRASVYGTNAHGDKAAFILPDGDKDSFVPDTDSVNLNGSSVAKLIYQARYSSDPTIFGNSRVGAWLSTIWNPLTGTPTAKASRYTFYLTTKSYAEDPDYPQEAGVLVLKAVQASGVEHGKVESLITVAAHERVATSTTEEAHGLLTEDGDVLEAETADSLLEEEDGTAYRYTSGKLVCNQNVLVFDGPDIGWNHDPEQDDDDGAGEPDDDAEPSTPRTAYPGYGTAWNNAGLTSGFAAGIAKARKPDVGGVPWTHGFFVSKRGAKAFSFRHQRYFGVCAVGFDPLDSVGARLMPYLGLGLDVAQAPLHLKGPVTLEHRREYVGDGSAAYTLAEDSFHGRTTVGTTTVKMGAVRLDVTDPTRGSEAAEITLQTRQAGALADVLHVGRGLYMEGLDDQGAGTANLSGLFIDNVLVLGTDPDAADAVSATSVDQTHKGMVVKATGPADTKFRGAVLYRHAATDDAASATELEFKSARPSKKIVFVDTDPLTSGTTYFYYIASYSKFDVESTVRTLIGSAVYRNIQGPDLEDAAVDLASGKVTNKSLANIDAAADTKLGGIGDGATKNRHWKQATDPSGPPTSATIQNYEEWTDTSVAPHVRRVRLAGVWEDSARDTYYTTHLSDAGDLSRLDLVTSSELDVGSVDLGSPAVAGTLPQGQGLSLSSGLSTPIGARILRFSVTDGDTVTYPDCGSLPDVDFFLGSLPVPAAGTQNIATPTGLTSTGFTASLKNVTPGVITQQDTGAGASDAGVPHPTIVVTGFSVAAGVTNPAFNGLYRLRLNMTFTPRHSYDTGRATIRLWLFNGATHTVVTDLDFGADAAGTWTGNVTVNLNADITFAATDKFEVNVVDVASGALGATAVINSFTFVRWQSQTPTGSVTATPNGETVTCYVTLPA